MACQSSSFTSTHSRFTWKAPQFHLIATSFPSHQPPSSVCTIQSFRKQSYLEPIRLTVPTYDGVSSGLWTSSRYLEGLRKLSMRKRGLVFRSHTVQKSTVKALQGAGRAPRRLVDVIRAIPRISKVYFKSPFRRALYGGIALLGGFYVAQTISLSFGALGVNDVIAAALCVLIAEYVTKFFYSRARVTFTVALLNNFKMGFTYGLFLDAFKLAS